MSSVVLTGLVRQYALWKNVLDIPNHRSSHTVPTPRGGGIAMVVVYLFALAYQLYQNGFSYEQFALMLGGGIIAFTGFLDDHHSLSAKWRLLIQFVVAIGLVFSVGKLPAILLFNQTIQPDLIGYPLLVVSLVWMTNLYNFMDGIDGLAGIEVVSVCVLMSAIYYASGFSPDHGDSALLLSAAAAGFLAWNFPPAKIFMGDVGSGFIGIVLGCFMLKDVYKEPKYLIVWLILLGIFVVDATMTLLYRIYMKERFYEAHKTHSFQYASRMLQSHKKVTLLVLCANVFWLAPIALLVAKDWIEEIVGFLIAYLPLLAVWARVRQCGREWDIINLDLKSEN